jgi:hypothetical protein
MHAPLCSDTFGLHPPPVSCYGPEDGGAGPASPGPRTLTLEACVQLLLIRRRLCILHDRQLAWKRADVAAKAAARKREWLAQRAKHKEVAPAAPTKAKGACRVWGSKGGGAWGVCGDFRVRAA